MLNKRGLLYSAALLSFYTDEDFDDVFQLLKLLPILTLCFLSAR